MEGEAEQPKRLSNASVVNSPENHEGNGGAGSEDNASEPSSSTAGVSHADETSNPNEPKETHPSEAAGTPTSESPPSETPPEESNPSHAKPPEVPAPKVRLKPPTATVKAPTWISSPILGHRYGQKVVSASPFASAKTPLARTESMHTPFAMTEPEKKKNLKGGGSQSFSRRMTYPIALVNDKSFFPQGFGAMRDPNNINQVLTGTTIHTVHTAKHSDEDLCMSTQPNPYWACPPTTMPPAQDTRAKEKLPRDVFHPLITASQAAENAKAATFNPSLNIIASPNRQHTPTCKTTTTHETNPAEPIGSPLYSPCVTIDDEMNGANEGFAMLERREGKGCVGGVFPKDAYAPTVVANVRPTSLTGIAARALCSAIHADIPPNSIPSNAAASVHHSTQEPNANRAPRYGKTVDASRKQRLSVESGKSGKVRIKAAVVPPSQAFRLLGKDLQSILRMRGGFTRSKVAAYLYHNQPVVAPPPEGLGSNGEDEEERFAVEDENTRETPPPAGNAGQPTEHVDQLFVGVRNDASLDDPVLEEEVILNSDSDVVSSSCLSLWKIAVQNSTLVPNSCETISASHKVRQATCGMPLNVLTPELVTAFNVASNQADFTTFFSSHGLRMGDHMTQVRPISPSAAEGGGGGGGGGFNTTQRSVSNAGPVSLGAVSAELRSSDTFLKDGGGDERACGAGGAAVKTLIDARTAPSAAFTYDTVRFLALLTEKGTEVEQIYFEGMHWLTVEVTSRIGDFCPQLRLLNLSNCPSLTNNALQNISKKCKLLSYVNISGCLSVSHKGVKCLLQNSSHLSVLCCHSVPNLDPDGDTFSYLHLCKNMKVLDVSYCEDISDMTLVNIAKYCPGLAFFDVSGCHRVGDAGLRSIGGRCGFLKILKIKLLCQQTVTPAGLALVSQAPRNLKDLDLSGISQLDDESVGKILCHCKSLGRLSLAGCTALTDASLSHVNVNCKQLRVINVSACKNFTLNSCMDLIYDITSLRCFLVSGSSISLAEVSILQSLREGCKVVLNEFTPPPVTHFWTMCQTRKPTSGGGGGAAAKKQKKK